MLTPRDKPLCMKGSKSYDTIKLKHTIRHLCQTHFMVPLSGGFSN